MIIAIPAYNAEKTIVRAMSSVVDQNDHRWKMRILLDAKTDDGTAMVARSWIDRHAPTAASAAAAADLIALGRSNGTSAAQVLADILAEIAVGNSHNAWHDDIVGVLDADDELMPDAVGIVLEEYAKDPECGAIWTQHIFADTEQEGESKPLPKNATLADAIVEQQHAWWWGNRHWTTFRASTYEASPMPMRLDVPYAVDLNLMCSLAASGCKAKFLKRICYIYHHSDGGVTSKHPDEQFMSVCVLREALRKHLRCKLEWQDLARPLHRGRVHNPR